MLPVRRPPAAHFPRCQGTLHQVEHPTLLLPCRGGLGGHVSEGVGPGTLWLVGKRAL